MLAHLGRHHNHKGGLCAWLLLLQGVQVLAYGPLGGPNAYVPNDLLPHPIVTKVAQDNGKTNGQVRSQPCWDSSSESS